MYEKAKKKTVLLTPLKKGMTENKCWLKLSNSYSNIAVSLEDVLHEYGHIQYE